MFNDCIENRLTLSFDSWTTDRKVVYNGLDFHVDIGSAHKINSPKYLIAVRQSPARIGTSNEGKIRAVFNNLDVCKYFCDIDRIRYPKDSVNINYDANEYLDEHEDLNLFYKEFVGEDLLNPFIFYSDPKNFYPIQIIDLRFQVGLINPKKIQLIEEYRADPGDAGLFLILIRHSEIKMVSDVNKITEIKVI